jgi:hypothetical protein
LRNASQWLKGVRVFLGVVALSGTWSTIPVQAAGISLNFEGLKNFEPVQNFYNGGLGGFGSGPGTNVGASFSSNALAVIDRDAGGDGNFGGEPSPSTVLFFLTGSAATLNYSAGFTTGFSFYYSAIELPGVIKVYDDLNATGNLLATLNLPLTPLNGAPDPTGQFSPFLPIGVAFSGIAKSIDFGGTANRIAFDNITSGSDKPVGTVPEPASVLLLASGLAGLAAWRRTRG